MTRLLEKAFKEASKLPVVNQNALAKWLLEELESENVLEDLADEAIEAHKKGKTKPLNIERL